MRNDPARTLTKSTAYNRAPEEKRAAHRSCELKEKLMNIASRMARLGTESAF